MITRLKSARAAAIREKGGRQPPLILIMDGTCDAVFLGDLVATT